jgi:hypothetical protein
VYVLLYKCRIRRIDQFVRLHTLRKIEDETERSEQIKEQRQYLIDQRKLAASQAMLHKRKIKEAMDKMKSSNKLRTLSAM